MPKLSVGDYLKGQEARLFEKAQDEYLVVMQNLVDIAFELLLDTGLAASGDKKTLTAWREIGNEKPKILAERIGLEWLDCLMLPILTKQHKNSSSFSKEHNELLLLKAQEKFGNLQTFDELNKASVLMMALALHLSRALGADTKGIAEHWIEIAKSHGASE